jgi:hypothetical protein
MTDDPSGTGIATFFDPGAELNSTGFSHTLKTAKRDK